MPCSAPMSCLSCSQRQSTRAFGLQILHRRRAKQHKTTARAAKSFPESLFREGLRSEVHPGIYGAWSIDDTDIAEVIAYRAGIIGAAFCAVCLFVGGTSLPSPVQQGLCGVGTVSFGISLALIHIYVTEIKRFIQLLFVGGAIGEVYLAISQGAPIPTYVAEHPWSTLLIGPAFAAVTGVAIKEGLCYQKAEAAVLALVTPLWLLVHLSGKAGPAVDTAGAALFSITFAVFAARKVTQSIKDDIGDKSVFEFRKLPEEQQVEVIKRIEDIQSGTDQ